MPEVVPLDAAREAQRTQALERANRIRLARAALKRRIATGALRPSEVVLECPWEAESMPLMELLRSQWRWGRSRSRRLLAALGLSESKTLGSLTERQRRLLAGALAKGQPGERLAAVPQDEFPLSAA